MIAQQAIDHYARPFAHGGSRNVDTTRRGPSKPSSTIAELSRERLPLSMLYTEGSVIVAMVYLFVPLMILTLVGVLEGIPRDLIDASASLGARPLMTFFQVILPLATPGLIVGAVLVFTGSFTSYATPQLLGGEKQMMMVGDINHRANVKPCFRISLNLLRCLVIQFGSDVKYYGIEGTSLPSTRTYGFNLNLKFKK